MCRKSLGAIGAGCALLLAACLRPPEPVTNAPSKLELASTQRLATLEGYALKIDGMYLTVGFTRPLAPGCHIVVTTRSYWDLHSIGYRSAFYGVSPIQPYVKYFKFDAQPGHRYTIEREYFYDPMRHAGRGQPWRLEIQSLVDRNERGKEERRYSGVEEMTAPPSC